MPSLLVGNGINNISNSISWKELLIDLMININKENIINLDKKPFLHIYEEIYTRGKRYSLKEEISLKKPILCSTCTKINLSQN